MSTIWIKSMASTWVWPISNHGSATGDRRRRNSRASTFPTNAASPRWSPYFSRTNPLRINERVRGIGTTNRLIPPSAAVEASGLNRSQNPTQQLVVSNRAYSSRP